MPICQCSCVSVSRPTAHTMSENWGKQYLALTHKTHYRWLFKVVSKHIGMVNLPCAEFSWSCYKYAVLECLDSQCTFHLNAAV